MPFNPTIHAYALTTLDAVKALLGITGSSDDAVLTHLINAATDWIERVTGQRRFKQTTHTNELFDGNGSHNLFTRNYPNVSITLLEKRTSPSAFETIASAKYYVDPVIGRILLDERTERGAANYRITYIAGYATIPTDLEQLCIKLVVDEFNSRSGGGGITQESLGEYSVTFADTGLLTDPFITKTVNAYKRHPVY